MNLFKLNCFIGNVIKIFLFSKSSFLYIKIKRTLKLTSLLFGMFPDFLDEDELSPSSWAKKCSVKLEELSIRLTNNQYINIKESTIYYQLYKKMKLTIIDF